MDTQILTIYNNKIHFRPCPLQISEFGPIVPRSAAGRGREESEGTYLFESMHIPVVSQERNAY